MLAASRSLPVLLCVLSLDAWGCSKGESVGASGAGGRADASVINVLFDAGQGGIPGSGGVGGRASGGTSGVALGGAGGKADAGPKPGCTGPLKVADPNLEAAIRDELTLPTGDILPEHVAKLTSLDANGKQIATLAGIDCLTALVSIDVGYNAITDLSPLASLTQLRALELRGLRTVDLTPLAPLTNLTSLSMGFNTTHIAGFGVVAGMTNLRTLEVYSADLDDISPITGCTQMYRLMIANNRISDVTPIAGFKKLDYLELFANNITDISPLANMATTVRVLDLGSNHIADISPLGRWAGNPNLEQLDLSNNKITDLGPLLSIPHLAPWIFDLTENPIDCTAQAANIAALYRNLDTDCR